MALNCLVFEKITFLQFGERQTNRQTDPMHEAALAVVSGGLKISALTHYLSVSDLRGRQDGHGRGPPTK